MRVLALLIGVILLAPGACALAFMGMRAFSLPSLERDMERLIVWASCLSRSRVGASCFLISYGGYRFDRSAAQQRPLRRHGN